MANTTNYSWETPDDTDLVKDGAAAIRTLGSAIDTTTKNLNPQTTTGAIAYRSATANVNTALPLGTAGQFLKVNSGATAPEWATLSAGGLTELATGTLSGSSVRVQSLAATYKALKVVIRGFRNTTDGYNLELRFNNDSGANRYYSNLAFATVSAGAAFNGTDIYVSTGDNTATESLIIIDIWDYANTSTWKLCQFYAIQPNKDTATSLNIQSGNGAYNQTAAINEITFMADGSTFAGGTYFIYGVN